MKRLTICLVLCLSLLCACFTADAEVSRIDRIGGLVGGVAVKAPCRVATTEATTLSGAQTIAGVALNVDASPRERVLVKDQASDIENGIYDVNSGAWTRSPDFDGARDAVDGTQVLINEGITPFAKSYYLFATNPVAIGTDSLTFTASTETTLFAEPDYTEADHGVTGGGNTIKAAVDAIGTTNKGTINCRHNSGGEFTDYIFLTSETIPSNIKLEFENGARLAPATGKTVTINGPLTAGPFQIFSGAGSISFGSIIHGNFEWTGATGDGTTDDTAACQKLVTALPAGSTVELLGKYVLTRQSSKAYGFTIYYALQAYNSLTFKGSGKDTAFLLKKNGVGGTIGLLFDDDDATGTFDSFIFDNIGFILTGAWDDHNRPVCLKGASNIQFRNCYFENVNSILAGTSASNTSDRFSFTGNTSINDLGAGDYGAVFLFTDKTASPGVPDFAGINEVIITNNQFNGTKVFIDMQDESVGPTQNSTLIISDNTIKGITETTDKAYGINVQENIKNITITGNTISGVTSTGTWGRGIEINTSPSQSDTPIDSLIISNNTIEGAKHESIMLINGEDSYIKDVIISNNVCRNDVDGGQGMISVGEDTESEDEDYYRIKISNNSLESPNDVGIYAAFAAINQLVINNNIVRNSGGHGIRAADLNGDVVIDSNYVYDSGAIGIVATTTDLVNFGTINLVVKDNVVEGSASYGMQVTKINDAIIKGNVSRGNTGSGLRVGGDNAPVLQTGLVIKNNILVSNGAYGIVDNANFTTTPIIMDNVIFGNTSGGIENDPIVAIEDNATPPVNKGNLYRTGGATTTITHFDDGYFGQVITFLAENAITITDGTNIFLQGSGNFVMASTDSLVLIQKGDGKWYEIGRSDNT